MTDEIFTPIDPNPYIVGNPVRGRAMFFGREAEFGLIRKRFEHSERGGLLVFCGERRSGKTSILYQILDHRLGPDFIPVLIDMQSMAVGGEIEFLARISELILEALGTDGAAASSYSPDFSGETNRAALFSRFVQQCLRDRPGRKLILLIDEYELFENKIDAGLLPEDVLHVLAALMESASVFMVFTGSQYIEQRRRGYWSILGKSGYKAVSYLEREDAISLIREPVAGRLGYDDDAVEAILRLSAGQPFYTQAICQNLVDQLNDRESSHADRASVDEVVHGIVDNPLPQMIFLWDGLERDDKLVLASLAECLEDGDAHVSAEGLLTYLAKKKYPIGLDRPRTATTLEKLFRSEMLLRSDRESAPAYAFRMDLWRLWIRRQHSVWQAMREVGLETRDLGGRRRWMIAASAAAVVIVLAALFLPRLARRAPDSAALAASGANGFLNLDVQPEDATLRIDGRREGVGGFHDAIAAGDHRFEVLAPGFADSAWTARVAASDTVSARVALRALVGDLNVETVPAGAEVRVDGRVVGKSPVTVRGLAVAKPHRVEAARDGFGVARTDVSVKADAVTAASLTLEMGKTDVVVTTEPGGDEVRVDGATRGASPVTISALTLGRHVFRAARDGFDPAETTVVVTDATKRLHLVLTREAPGVLVVRGELPAQIYVDGALVVENVQNSGPRSLPPGNHTVRVILVSGESSEHSVAVRSGERVTWDFTKNSVTRRPEGRP